MVCLCHNAMGADSHTGRQRRRRLRSQRLPLGKAVRCAVNAFFRFSHRAADRKALWSETERVWLGQATFLDWALRDSSIDIPWIVARAAGAPRAVEELLAAVRAELIRYWTVQVGRLPRSGKPYWIPLP